MERLKSKTTLLVALVLAAVLAMTGVGYALANPNDESTVIASAESNDSKSLKGETGELIGSPYYNYYNLLTFTVDNGLVTIQATQEYIKKTTPGLYICVVDSYEEALEDSSYNYSAPCPKFDSDNKIQVDISNCGVGTYYLGFHNTLDGIAVLPITVSESNPITPVDPAANGLAFTFNFKATGIQATGFNDYHEAFAALNN